MKIILFDIIIILIKIIFNRNPKEGGKPAIFKIIRKKFIFNIPFFIKIINKFFTFIFFIIFTIIKDKIE